MLKKGTIVACLAMTLLACEAPGPVPGIAAENGESANFYAADTGIAEGSPEAMGVLTVANTLSRDDLDYKVALTSTAANSIDSYRKGADGIAGTADDKRFTTVAQLDAVPYVGTTTLNQILAYARANGYVKSTASIFDPSWQTGVRITAAQAAARFAPGATRADVGKFAIAMRNRSCNAISGCTSWNYPAPNFAWMTYKLWIPGPGWTPQKSCFQFETAGFPTVGGNAVFVITGTQVALSLEGSPIGSTSCADIVGSTKCANFQTSGAHPSGGSACSLPNPAGSGIYPDVYPVSVPLYDTTATTGTPLVFNPLVTAQYAYALSSSKSDADTSGSYREVQYALYVSLDGKTIPGTGAPTCTPTTCSAKGAGCGMVDDGCGGTLNCGSCGYPYLCSANQCVLPPGCNLQPCGSGASVSYTCCGAGQTTCGGVRGCTCYDACF